MDELKKGYKKRLDIVVKNTLNEPPGNGARAVGSWAAAQLLLGEARAQKEAESLIRKTAEWFRECPYVERGVRRPMHGECDFAALRLARLAASGADRLEEETRKMTAEFFLKNDFSSQYKSENHILIFRAARYIASGIYRNEMFEVYQKTGAELHCEDADFLRSYLQYRGRHGWGEFDSTAYMSEDMGALLALYDFGEESLANLARMSIEQLLLDMLSDTTDGFYCGAHGRIYSEQALNHMKDTTMPIYAIYFGGKYFSPKIRIPQSVFADFALTTFVPSDYIYEIAANKPKCYENYETAPLHSITREPPQKLLEHEEGHISKYTYITPGYAVGSVCFQDDYKNPDAAWYAHHEQHEWDLSFAGNPEAKIFTHHPGAHGTEGAEHGYWTGDLECCCGTFYSNKNRVMAMYDIPDGEEQEINAYALLELYEVVEDGNYIFFGYGDSYASLYFSQGYYHADGKYKGREIRSRGAKHAVVCEAGTISEYGSLEGFIEAIKKRPIIFDKDKMTLSCGNMYMDKNTRRLDGSDVKFPFPLFENPFVHSELGSGIITVATSKGKTILDFNNIIVKHEP